MPFNDGMEHIPQAPIRAMPAKPSTTVLIVEDRKSFRAALREFIALQFPHFNVHEAETGAAALEKFEQHQPRLVIMDIRLPDISGIEITRRIKALAPATTVIAMSMLTEAQIAGQALAAGATAFINKDHLFRELVPLIQLFSNPDAGTSNTNQ